MVSAIRRRFALTRLTTARTACPTSPARRARRLAERSLESTAYRLLKLAVVPASKPTETWRPPKPTPPEVAVLPARGYASAIDVRLGTRDPGRFERLAGVRRRTARGTDREEEAFGELDVGNRRASVREPRESEWVGRVRVRAETRRRACRAVQRRLQFAGEVVMLERRADEENCVEGETDEPQAEHARHDLMITQGVRMGSDPYLTPAE